MTKLNHYQIKSLRELLERMNGETQRRHKVFIVSNETEMKICPKSNIFQGHSSVCACSEANSEEKQIKAKLSVNITSHA